MEPVEVIMIPRDSIGAMLPHLGVHLLRGLSVATDQRLPDVLDGIVDGSRQLWAVMTPDHIYAAFLTSVLIRTDGTKAVDVYGLGGERIAEWGDLISERMAGFAKANDCDKVLFCGRKGLCRVYTDVKIVGERGDGIYQFERAVQ